MSEKRNFILAIFFLIFIILTIVILLQEPQTLLGRAESRQLDPDRSLAIAWPLAVTANGQDSSQIKVFLLSKNEKAVPGKTVTVKSSLGTATPSTTTSDQNGQANFFLTSAHPGTAQISFIVENQPLPQQLQIIFE